MHDSVADARHVRDFVVWLKFADGSEGEVDLSQELWGPVFEPLERLSGLTAPISLSSFYTKRRMSSRE